jgi:hypothetical protein
LHNDDAVSCFRQIISTTDSLWLLWHELLASLHC